MQLLIAIAESTMLWCWELNDLLHERPALQTTCFLNRTLAFWRIFHKRDVKKPGQPPEASGPQWKCAETQSAIFCFQNSENKWKQRTFFANRHSLSQPRNKPTLCEMFVPYLKGHFAWLLYKDLSHTNHIHVVHMWCVARPKYVRDAQGTLCWIPGHGPWLDTELWPKP